MAQQDPPPSIPNDDTNATTGGSEPTISPELLKETLDKKLGELEQKDKVGTNQTSRRWLQVVGEIILILVVGAVIWSLLVALGFIPNPISRDRNYIRLTSMNDQHLVTLVKQGDTVGVKLVDPTSGAVQDISIGDVNASHAVLSPTGDQIAYVSTDADGSELYLVNISGSITQTFGSSALKAAAPSSDTWETVTVCEWSDLYWSTTVDQLAFFGCSKNLSALFTVPIQANTTPKAISNTESSSGKVRDAAWLENGNIVLTSGSEPFDSLLLIDLSGQQQRLYGPVK